MVFCSVKCHKCAQHNKLHFNAQYMLMRIYYCAFCTCMCNPHVRHRFFFFFLLLSFHNVV